MHALFRNMRLEIFEVPTFNERIISHVTRGQLIITDRVGQDHDRQLSVYAANPARKQLLFIAVHV